VSLVSVDLVERCWQGASRFRVAIANGKRSGSHGEKKRNNGPSGVDGPSKASNKTPKGTITQPAEVGVIKKKESRTLVKGKGRRKRRNSGAWGEHTDMSPPWKFNLDPHPKKGGQEEGRKKGKLPMSGQSPGRCIENKKNR